MPKQGTPSRKISVDLPLNLWDRYREIGKAYGMKIKEYILGAFEAADFLDKFLSETLTEEQIKNISPLLRNNLEKYESLYCGTMGKIRSRNLDKSNVIYFDKNNSQNPDLELSIRTHDIVQNFAAEDRFSLDLSDLKRKRSRKLENQIIIR